MSQEEPVKNQDESENDQEEPNDKIKVNFIIRDSKPGISKLLVRMNLNSEQRNHNNIIEKSNNKANNSSSGDENLDS